MVQIPGDRVLRHEIDGNKIKARRKELGLALTDVFLEIHRRFGVKIFPQSMNAWEKGQSYPTTKRLEYLAAVLEVDPEYFYV